MYYLAYGSNLHPVRLTGRVPNARFVGTTELSGYQLAFHKRGIDGSAKCNLVYTSDPEHVAFAAVYLLPEDEVHALDEAEGLGRGYHKQQLCAVVEGESVNAFAYFASETHLDSDLNPYCWYKGLVLAGVRHHDFPPHYIQKIDAVSSRQDRNTGRRMENENLLALIAS
jgi:gamma-glutamylcyclotransferase (GGCT)/AIG2-like uncharacterized protein YtfP